MTNECCGKILKSQNAWKEVTLEVSGVKERFYAVECGKCKKVYVRAFDVLDAMNQKE